jgi:hypothetical protein
MIEGFFGRVSFYLFDEAKLINRSLFANMQMNLL